MNRFAGRNSNATIVGTSVPLLSTTDRSDREGIGNIGLTTLEHMDITSAHETFSREVMYQITKHVFTHLRRLVTSGYLFQPHWRSETGRLENAQIHGN